MFASGDCGNVADGISPCLAPRTSPEQYGYSPNEVRQREGAEISWDAEARTDTRRRDAPRIDS